MTITLLDRAQGCLVGLCAGDAVGTTNEFKRRDSTAHITDMVGGGPFNLNAGQYTDDSSMALCMAASLIKCKGFDAEDQMSRYLRWYTNGYMSSTDHCFDIGDTTRRALNNFKISGDPFSGCDHPHSAGNGSLMRLAPLAIFFHNANAHTLTSLAADSSSLTHAATECKDACSIYASMLVTALKGESKENILVESCSGISSENIIEIIDNKSYQYKTREAISSSGYVIHSLEAALWAFWNTDNFKDCILTAANLFDDADTVAAIAGQIAGAHYGLSGIPQKWIELLYDSKDIQAMARLLIHDEEKWPSLLNS